MLPTQKTDHLPILLLSSSELPTTIWEPSLETEVLYQTQRESASQLMVGVDLGGTQIRAAVVRDADIISRIHHPTPAEEGPEAVVAKIVDAIHEALELAEVGIAEIGGIGVSAPGPLDPKSGVVFESPNLRGWYNVPLRDMIAQLANLPVYLGHDASLAGLAELKFGAGRGSRDMIYMTVSTGIGGGIITNGKIIDGVSGTAGEIGHMYLDPRLDAPRDGMGHIGCLEAFSSGTAIARDANDLIAQGKGEGILDAHRAYLASHPDFAQSEPANAPHLQARDVVAAAEAGDSEATEMLHRAGYMIGLGCVNLIHAFNPDRIVIGGGVTNAGAFLFDPIRTTVKERAFERPAEVVQIVEAQLGGDGGLIGAAAFVTYQREQGL